MGKKDKHKPGQSRNNPIFKVVGGKAGKSKNKPREVNIKLKNVRKKYHSMLTSSNLITETFSSQPYLFNLLDIGERKNYSVYKGSDRRSRCQTYSSSKEVSTIVRQFFSKTNH